MPGPISMMSTLAVFLSCVAACYAAAAMGPLPQASSSPANVDSALDQYNTRTVLNNLPRPLPHPSATVCGSKLYVAGDGGDGYSCSLSQIATSNHPIRSPPALTWTPMPPSLVTFSTIACLSNKPLLVGGTARNTHADSRAIYINYCLRDSGWSVDLHLMVDANV